MVKFSLSLTRKCPVTNTGKIFRAILQLSWSSAMAGRLRRGSLARISLN